MRFLREVGVGDRRLPAVALEAGISADVVLNGLQVPHGEVAEVFRERQRRVDGGVDARGIARRLRARPGLVDRSSSPTLQLLEERPDPRRVRVPRLPEQRQIGVLESWGVLGSSEPVIQRVLREGPEVRVPLRPIRARFQVPARDNGVGELEDVEELVGQRGQVFPVLEGDHHVAARAVWRITRRADRPVRRGGGKRLAWDRLAFVALAVAVAVTALVRGQEVHVDLPVAAVVVGLRVGDGWAHPSRIGLGEERRDACEVDQDRR